MRRMGAVIVGMELAALLVAVLAFGWPTLVVLAPLFVATLVAFAVFRLWAWVEPVRERRAVAGYREPAHPGGLMSGFFEVSAVRDQPAMPTVDLPFGDELRRQAGRLQHHALVLAERLR